MANPFVAYDDGYDWPDLYTECDEMVETCVLVYLLAELRGLVRRGEATNKTEQVMRMPLPARDLMKVIDSSRELLTTNYSTCGELAAYSTRFSLELLRTTDERLMRIKKRKKKARKENARQSPDKADDSNYPEEDGTKPIIGATTFLSFDDDLKKEELDYAIGVNHDRRRITICFRGSVVSNVEWATDFDSSMREVKNPMKMHSSQQPTMKVHSKLHDLLYAESLRKVAESGVAGSGGGAGMNNLTIRQGGEAWTEFMDILQNKVRPATCTYPGYKVCCNKNNHCSVLAMWLAVGLTDLFHPCRL
jgi:Lipase (class 3)